MANVGEKCETCGFTVTQVECDGGETIITGCSEFCARATDKELADFRAGLKDGEYGVFPCTMCGDILEGEYEPGVICTACVPKRKIQVRDGLLRECLQHLPSDLKDRVLREIDD